MRSIALQVVREPEIGHGILKLNYVQVRESGCKNHYVTVMLADAKAKTVTSLLTQLTVLVVVYLSLKVSVSQRNNLEFITFDVII